MASYANLVQQVKSKVFTYTADAAYFAQPYLQDVKEDSAVRMMIERTVIRRFLEEAKKLGLDIGWSDGESSTGFFRNVEDLMQEVQACDEERIVVKDKNRYYGFLLVYGNEGYTVFADWSPSLAEKYPSLEAVIDDAYAEFEHDLYGDPSSEEY